MSDFVCVKTFPNRVEAELAKGLLESQGIPAFVAADDCGGMRPYLNSANGVRLLVKEEDVETAGALLEN